MNLAEKEPLRTCFRLSYLRLPLLSKITSFYLFYCKCDAQNDRVLDGLVVSTFEIEFDSFGVSAFRALFFPFHQPFETPYYDRGTLQEHQAQDRTRILSHQTSTHPKCHVDAHS
jgi:hypothetical protein